MWSEERHGPVDRKKKRKYTCSFQFGESRGAPLPNLLRVRRRSSALQSQQRLHICSLIRKQLLQTSGSAVKVKNTKGSCTDRRGNLRVKHQVSEALKSPDDYRRHSALCDVCNKLQVKKRKVEEGGGWYCYELVRLWGLSEHQNSHKRRFTLWRKRRRNDQGECRGRRVFQSKTQNKSLNYLTIFLSCLGHFKFKQSRVRPKKKILKSSAFSHFL